MQKSTTYLPDVNVWLALASRRHIHNSLAVGWFEGLGQEPLVFCRITQMGLLRLLTNTKVMGHDVLSQTQAWDAYGHIRQDTRIHFLNEPAELEKTWRSLTQQVHPATHSWTDAYLLAFTQVAKLTLVSFDLSFKAVTETAVTVLE